MLWAGVAQGGGLPAPELLVVDPDRPAPGDEIALGGQHLTGPGCTVQVRFTPGAAVEPHQADPHTLRVRVPQGAQSGAVEVVRTCTEGAVQTTVASNPLPLLVIWREQTVFERWAWRGSYPFEGTTELLPGDWRGIFAGERVRYRYWENVLTYLTSYFVSGGGQLRFLNSWSYSWFAQPQPWWRLVTAADPKRGKLLGIYIGDAYDDQPCRRYVGLKELTSDQVLWEQRFCDSPYRHWTPAAAAFDEQGHLLVLGVLIWVHTQSD